MATIPIPVPTPTKKPSSVNTGLVGQFGQPISTSFLDTSYSLLGPQQVLGASTAYPTQSTSTSKASTSLNTSPITQANNANLQSVNTQYDQVLSGYNNQLSDLGRQKNQAVSDIENAQNQVINSANQQKADVENQKLSTIGQAADTARNTQRVSRNVLRALGILNSSYAGDKLQEPMNQFDKARSDIVQQAQTRVSQLDDFVNNKKAEFANQIANINNTFASMQERIQSDIRFTDRSRADAVNQLQAAYNQKMAELRNSTSTAVQQAEAAKAFVINGLQTAMGQNPDLGTNLDSLNTLYNNLSQMGSKVYGTNPQQIGLEDQKKKNDLYGINYGLSNGGLTLSGMGR